MVSASVAAALVKPQCGATLACSFNDAHSPRGDVGCERLLRWRPLGAVEAATLALQVGRSEGIHNSTGKGHQQSRRASPGERSSNKSAWCAPRVSNPALAMSLGAFEVAVAGCVIFGPQKFGVGDIVLLQGVAQAEACLLRGCVRADSGVWVFGEILVKMSEGLGCSRWWLQVEVGTPLSSHVSLVDQRTHVRFEPPERCSMLLGHHNKK